MSPAIRIGIDIRAMGGASGRRGVGSYVRGLISGLAQEALGTGDDIVLFASGSEEPQDLPLNVTLVRLTRPRRAITLWDQIAWPPLLARRKVAVFHSPFYAIPRLRPAGCRVVQTVHDLTPLKLPGAVSRRAARIFRINFRLARSADRIIVPSEATRRDVLSLLRYPAERIAVIPEATDIGPGDIVAADREAPGVLSRLGIQGRYLLHTGGHDVVKNLPLLLEAFASLSAQGHDLELVIAGDHGRNTGAIIARGAALGLLDRLRLPGFLPREDLVALYRGASAVVYPSWAEGFGLPVMEAMACGAPVVASSAGALPEVGGDACVYVDPASADQIASAVARILDDPQAAADLSLRGRSRAALYTWRETARRTMAVYRELAA